MHFPKQQSRENVVWCFYKPNSRTFLVLSDGACKYNLHRQMPELDGFHLSDLSLCCSFTLLSMLDLPCREGDCEGGVQMQRPAEKHRVSPQATFFLLLRFNFCCTVQADLYLTPMFDCLENINPGVADICRYFLTPVITFVAAERPGMPAFLCLS